tara:strand:- start:1731 stop:2564 length:834 start_codon:yes stop_codon:yes gene_type:complete
MNIAFCLFGLSGSASESQTSFINNNKDERIMEIFNESYTSYKKYIFDENKECNIDTYLHTYEHKNIEKVLEVYKPKKYLIEKKFQHTFNRRCNLKDNLNIGVTHFHNDNNYKLVNAGMSRFNSMFKALNLVDKNINYDYIIILRFDLLFLKPIKFNELKLKEKDVICPFTMYPEYKNLRKEKEDKPSTYMALNENLFPWHEWWTIDFFYILKKSSLELFLNLCEFGKTQDGSYSIMCKLQPERFFPKYIEANNFNCVKKYKVFFDFMKTREYLYDRF